MDKIAISNYGTAPEGMGEEAENLCEPTSILDLIEIPKDYALEQNFPNPFNPATQFVYSLPKISEVNISIYNIIGERVEVLYSGKRNAGKYHITWDGSKYSSGTYFIRFKADDNIQIKKCILLK